MKVTVKENDKKVFNPITIELVIENEKELCNLYNRLSIDSDCVNVNVIERLKYNSLITDLIV